MSKFSPEELAENRRQNRECQDPECHIHSWRIGRSEDTIEFVDRLENAVWGWTEEEKDPELTDFQRGLLVAEAGNIKKGARPPVPLAEYEDYMMLFKMFSIDCPP